MPLRHPSLQHRHLERFTCVFPDPEVVRERRAMKRMDVSLASDDNCLLPHTHALHPWTHRVEEDDDDDGEALNQGITLSSAHRSDYYIICAGISCMYEIGLRSSNL